MDTGAAYRRLHQAVLIGATVLCSWLGMMIVHEGGHVLGAVATGGKVRTVVLTPVGFSRTDLSENPSPLVVVWAGPSIGVLAPLIPFGIAAAVRVRWAYLPRFFAGFCGVANGAYIGGASFGQIGDAYPMLLFGSKPWHLWLFGVLATSAGLWLWNGLGPSFGLGPNARTVRPVDAYVMLGLLCLIVVAEIGLMPG